MSEKYKWVCGTVVICVFLICSFLLFVNMHPYTLRFEADDNIRESMVALKEFDLVQIQTEGVVIDSDESNVSIYVSDGDGIVEQIK